MRNQKKPGLWMANSKKRKNRLGSKERKIVTEKLLTTDPYCAYCGVKLVKDTATLDHIIPLSKGGSNHYSNLVLACSDCNHDKGNNVVKDYMPPERHI